MLNKIVDGKYSQADAIDMAKKAYKEGKISKAQLDTTLKSILVLFAVGLGVSQT